MKTNVKSYRGYRFPPEIISHGVGYPNRDPKQVGAKIGLWDPKRDPKNSGSSHKEDQHDPLLR